MPECHTARHCHQQGVLQALAMESYSLDRCLNTHEDPDVNACCLFILHKLYVQVEFSLFGLVPGHVGLRGKLEEVDGDKDTVKVWHQDGLVSQALW